MWMYDDLDEFRNDVNRISENIRDEQFQEAMNQWELGRIVDLDTILTETDLLLGYYEYNPQQRLYVQGDPTPATCLSDPMAVNLSVGKPIPQKIMTWEKKYDICHHYKGRESMDEYIADRELAVGIVLGKNLFDSFWYGYDAASSYGLLTHPLTSVTPTPNPAAPADGVLTNFQRKTSNEIYGEFRDKMYGMIRPQIAISDRAWGGIEAKSLGDGSNCNRLGDCVLNNLAQSVNGFDRDAIFPMKWLDELTIGATTYEGAYVIWDAAAVEFPFADPAFISAIPRKKELDRINQIPSAGAIVKYSESVFVVTGINVVDLP